MRIEELFQTVLSDEPVSVVDPTRIASTARRRRATRITAATSAALVAAATAIVIATQHSTPQEPTVTTRLQLAAAVRAGHPIVRPATSITAITGPSGSTRPTNGGAPASDIASIVRSVTGANLTDTYVFTLSPVMSVNLSAGVAARTGRGGIDVQVFPAGDVIKGRPQCAELSTLALGGDGYTGPCSVHRVAGGYLVQRLGTTRTGGFKIAAVSLIAFDGSAVLVDVTNQASATLDRNGVRVRRATPPPVIQADPPLGLPVLTRLVLRLHSDPPTH